MAQNGIVQRFKGKIAVGDMVVGPAGVSDRTITAGTTASNLPNAGYISLSTFTTAAGNPTLGPPFAGASVIVGTTAASTGFKVQASSSGQINFCSTNFAFALGSSSGPNVTAAQAFVGLSTSQWMPIGGFGTVAFSTV